MVIMSLGSPAAICTKSHLSKLLARDEIGKIMSFLSIMNTVSPLLCTTIFAYIFKYTINSYPGAVYHVIAGLLLILTVIVMWIDLFTEPPLCDGEDDQQSHSGEKGNNEQGGKESVSELEYNNNHLGHHYKTNRISEQNNDECVPNSSVVPQSQPVMITSL